MTRPVPSRSIAAEPNPLKVCSVRFVRGPRSRRARWRGRRSSRGRRVSMQGPRQRCGGTPRQRKETLDVPGSPRRGRPETGPIRKQLSRRVESAYDGLSRLRSPFFGGNHASVGFCAWAFSRCSGSAPRSDALRAVTAAIRTAAAEEPAEGAGTWAGARPRPSRRPRRRRTTAVPSARSGREAGCRARSSPTRRRKRPLRSSSCRT